LKQQYQQMHWKMTKAGRKEAKSKGVPFEWTRPTVEVLVEQGQLFREHCIEDGEEPQEEGVSKAEMEKVNSMLGSMKQRENDEGEYTKEDFKGLESGWRDTFAQQQNDPVYNKFRKTIAKAPNQCIRYDRGGEPLWASSENQPKDGEITLADDGAPRTFEFQLLPPVLKNCAACAHSNFCVVLQTLYHLDIEKQLKNVLEANHQSTLDFGTIAV